LEEKIPAPEIDHPKIRKISQESPQAKLFRLAHVEIQERESGGPATGLGPKHSDASEFGVLPEHGKQCRRNEMFEPGGLGEQEELVSEGDVRMLLHRGPYHVVAGSGAGQKDERNGTASAQAYESPLQPCAPPTHATTSVLALA